MIRKPGIEERLKIGSVISWFLGFLIKKKVTPA